MSRSIETLVHFLCSVCKRWWSIADADSDRLYYCPWCGVRENEKDKWTITPTNGGEARE